MRLFSHSLRGICTASVRPGVGSCAFGAVLYHVTPKPCSVGVELVFRHEWPTQALDAEAKYHFQYTVSSTDAPSNAALIEPAALNTWQTLPTEAHTPLAPDVADRDRFQRRFQLNGLLAGTWYAFRVIAGGTSGSSLPSDPSPLVETKGTPPSCEPLLQIKQVSTDAVTMIVSFQPPEGRTSLGQLGHIHVEQQSVLFPDSSTLAEHWSPSEIMVTRYAAACIGLYDSELLLP